MSLLRRRRRAALPLADHLGPASAQILGELADVLVPDGWSVEIDAEPYGQTRVKLIRPPGSPA